MYALVVRFDVRDDAAAAEFDTLTEGAVQMIKEREPGTLVYAAHRIEGEPLARVFYEVYRDREAFQAHETADHVIDFHRRKNPLVVSHRVEFLAPSYAKGLAG
jgi:quinol monooxygenase YgiN